MKLHEIIHGDCLEIMKGMADKCVDLVLTDPPYGISYNNNKLNRKSNATYSDIANDNGELDYKSLIQELMRIGKRVVIFGAINFFKDLPYKGIWICWDKRTKEEADGLFGSPFELAWCDKIGGYDKIYRIMHGGVINNDGASSPRFHPTQKPIQLMQRIMQDFSKEGDLILDPFAGSCTTLIACKQLNRRCICIEKEEDYVKICHERLGATSNSLT